MKSHSDVRTTAAAARIDQRLSEREPKAEDAAEFEAHLSRRPAWRDAAGAPPAAADGAALRHSARLDDEELREGGALLAGPGGLWIGAAPHRHEAGDSASEVASSWSQVAAQIDRLLVGVPGEGPTAAMFTLASDLLTDTSVCLTRSPQGWMLRIQTQDSGLLRDAARHESALRTRFARHGLGELSIEHGVLPLP